MRKPRKWVKVVAVMLLIIAVIEAIHYLQESGSCTCPECGELVKGSLVEVAASEGYTIHEVCPNCNN
jgi:hypothetical protein